MKKPPLSSEDDLIRIADLILPPLFVLIGAVVIYTAPDRIRMSAACIIFLGLNLLISSRQGRVVIDPL